MMKYDDIINYKYEMKHQRMPISMRSYEFAPFSALIGFTDLIKEMGRETDKKRELSSEEKEILDYKLKLLNSKISNHLKVEITFFVSDSTKDGGSYKIVNDYLKKIDFYHKLIILENKEKIKIENIVNIDSLDIDLNEFLS